MGDPYAPSDDWREGYQDGYATGFKDGMQRNATPSNSSSGKARALRSGPTKKRKPTAYNNFVAKKSQLSKFKYKSTRGKKKKGMTNLKAIGVAWRKLSKAQQNKYK